MKTKHRVVFSLLGFAFAVAAGAACTKKDTNTPEPKAACTEEAKVCPDGSSVGRTGPDCAFAECPAAAEPESDKPDGETPEGETPPAAEPAADAE